MERRRLLTGALAAVGVWVMSRSGTDPRRVTEADIEGVREWARSYRETDFRRGGAVAREGAMVQLIASANLMEADCPDELRPALQRAFGDLAEAAGYAAYDAGQWAEAESAWLAGLRYVSPEGSKPVDPSLWAQLMGSLARQHIWLGRAEIGIHKVDQAIDQAEDLPAKQLAELWAVRALGLASMGKVHLTRAAIDCADYYMAEATEDAPSDSTWVYNDVYDEAMHSGVVAHALTDLVVGGHEQLAGAAARRQAVAMLGASQTRSQLLATITGATVVMAAGDPEKAVALGHDALDVMPLVASARARMKLRTLQSISRRVDRRDVADLRARIERVA